MPQVIPAVIATATAVGASAVGTATLVIPGVLSIAWSAPPDVGVAEAEMLAKTRDAISDHSLKSLARKASRSARRGEAPVCLAIGQCLEPIVEDRDCLATDGQALEPGGLAILRSPDQPAHLAKVYLACTLDAEGRAKSFAFLSLNPLVILEYQSHELSELLRVSGVFRRGRWRDPQQSEIVEDAVQTARAALAPMFRAVPVHPFGERAFRQGGGDG